MHIFYTPDIETNQYTMNEAESKHCIRVLRLSIDDKICLLDGKGGYYIAKITDNHYKRCSVKVIENTQNYGMRSFNLHIAIASTKNIDRFEWFIEKACEIGIDEITPLLCQRSERKIIKPERLNKILISAIKQSVKAYLPKFNDLTKFNDFIKLTTNNDSQKFIAHCLDNDKKAIKDIYIKKNNAVILIGPEGDFSETEIQSAIENKYKAVSLGNSRLRTETAGVVACHTVNFLND